MSRTMTAPPITYSPVTAKAGQALSREVWAMRSNTVQRGRTRAKPTSLAETPGALRMCG